jgi:hypothetical protein
LLDVTVLLPIHRDGRRDWLQQAINSFPKGTPTMVLENDGEVVESLNTGLRESTTEFVVAFGSDDIACPNYLQNMLALGVYADVVYPAMTLVNEDLTVAIGDAPAYPFCPLRLMQMNYIAGPSLVRRQKALEVGGYRNVQFEDWDLWVRMHRAGARFKPSPQSRLLYRQVEGSRRRELDDPASLRETIVGKPDPLEDAKATFYPGATPATTYVRCQLPARVMPAIVRPDISYSTDGGDIVYHEHVGDTAIFQFGGNKTAALVSGSMKANGVQVLIEVDDNYLINPGPKILERQGWAMKIGQAENTRDGHRWIVKWADGVIVSTEHLAEQYRPVNPNVHVVPNSVDPADWPVPVKPDDGVFRICWFASQSHEDDIPIVTRAMEWASRQPGVEVWMVGLNPKASLKFKQRWRFPYGQVPWLNDLDDYRHHFQAFDLGLAPVSKNPSGLGRSDLKSLEYVMGGVLPVMQDAAPYAWWHDKPGLIAADSEGFLRHVQWAVANQDEVRALAGEALELVLRERTNLAQRGLYQEAIAA